MTVSVASLLGVVLVVGTLGSCRSPTGTAWPSGTASGQATTLRQGPAVTTPGAARTVRLTNGEWPPYMSEDLEDYGVASRIVTEAFALEGIEVEYGFFPWVRGYELARSGEWDGSVVWMRTPEREKEFYFSEPVVRSIYVFWHLKSFEFDWEAVEDLKDVTIGGTRGYFYEDTFSSLEQAGKVRVEWVSVDEQNLMKLLTGRIDLYVQDVLVGESMLRANLTQEEKETITHHPRPLRTDDLRLMLSRRVEKNEWLIGLFNEGLRQLRAGGRVDSRIGH